MEKSLKFSGMMSVSPYNVEFTVQDGEENHLIDADELFRMLTGIGRADCGVEMAITMRILDNRLEIGGSEK